MSGSSTGKTLLWIFLFAIVLAFLPQVPGCVMTNAPKAGRVVDATTGEGMPGVTVIASAHFFAQNPVHGSASDYPYRIITQTDAHGAYYIPATWQDISFAFPGMEAREEWLVTAFKPRHAVVGDEQAWKEFNKYGEKKYKPYSVVVSPPLTWRGLYFEVDPIRLQPVNLTLREAAIYYNDITGLGLYSVAMRKPEEIALRKIGYDMFQPSVCALDGESTMDSTEAVSLVAYVFDRRKFIESLRTVEPSGFGDAYRYPVFHAKNVCAAMKAGEL